jgi:hypothetical protein
MGMKRKNALYHRRSAGVALRKRSPEDHRAIQINIQGGMTFNDA